MLPTLATPRLQLRTIRAEDAADLWTVFGDPEVMRYGSSPPLADVAAAAASIARMDARAQAGSLMKWGLVPIGEDRLIGTCALAEIDLSHQRAMLGYALARARWGQGLATEAVRAVIDFGFRTLELHRIGADVDPRNTASLRLLAGLGFTREGVQRETCLVMGEWQDTTMLGLLRREWAG